MSAIDAVDGSSTRHVSAMDVGAVEVLTIQRSYPCRQLRQSVSTSPSRSSRSPALCRWPSGDPPSVEASLRPGVLPEVAVLPDRHRGLRFIAPLVARISAGAISLAERPDRAIWVTSVRTRREDRTSISSCSLADLGGQPVLAPRFDGYVRPLASFNCWQGRNTAGPSH